jgi:hypothetical protein
MESNNTTKPVNPAQKGDKKLILMTKPLPGETKEQFTKRVTLMMKQQAMLKTKPADGSKKQGTELDMNNPWDRDEYSAQSQISTLDKYIAEHPEPKEPSK